MRYVTIVVLLFCSSSLAQTAQPSDIGTPANLQVDRARAAVVAARAACLKRLGRTEAGIEAYNRMTVAERLRAATADTPAAAERLNAAATYKEARRRLARLEQETLFNDPQLRQAGALLRAAGTTAQPGATTARPPFRRVVFVLDFSASMLEHVDRMTKEIAQTIGNLHPDQEFAIIVDSDGNCSTSADSLTLATDQNKAAAMSLLHAASPIGKDDLLLAVTMAANMQPDLIWLFTDGDVSAGPQPLLARIQAIAPMGIRINTTLGYGADRDAHDRAHQHLLWNIAQRTGGVCIGVDGRPVQPAGQVTTPDRR